MAVGCPRDFPPFGFGGSSLRRRGRDDAGHCGCTENGEKYHTIAHFNLHSSGIHDTDRHSYSRLTGRDQVRGRNESWLAGPAQNSSSSFWAFLGLSQTMAISMRSSVIPVT